MARKLKSGLKTWVRGLAALGLAASACMCQQFSFSTITEGLGNLNVNCMAQDRSGYLWVGTENGLYRYDGRVFRQFSSADGLHGHIIENLFAAPDGTLFVGTTTGIYFERRDGQFSQIHAPAPVTEFSARIGTVFTALAPDQVATSDRSGGFVLRRIAADSWVAEPMYLDGASVWSVLAAPGNVLWYGCDADLCRRQNGVTTHLRAALKLPEEQWHHLRLTRDGHLWVRGVTHLAEVMPEDNSFAEHDVPGQSNTSTYADLVEDTDGHIVASQGAALGIWEGDHWRMVTALNGLSRYDISALFVDQEGSLWMGVVGHGLMRWVGQDRWEAYTSANGLSDDIVWSSLRDRSGRLWIGTESGLDYLPAGETAPRAWQAPGIQTARAVSLTQSADGSVWIGSAAGSLVRIEPAKMTGSQWKLPEVHRVLADGGHRVWIATSSGLYVVDTASGERSPRLVEDAGITRPLQRFTDLNLDKNKTLWAAADDGLYRMDDLGWHRIDPGLANVSPYVIAADAAGNIWAAGAFPGLVRLRIVGDRIVESEHIVSRNLLSERVVSLAVDHRGWVWVGQDAGLTVYDGHAWRSFTQDDGLIWNDTDSEALAEDTDGTMWIGTSGGLSHLLRPQPVTASSPPAPVFSQIMFGAEPIVNQAEVRWSASTLAITVSAPSYRDASHIRIRYRLMGADSGWMETAERIVRYTHLEPGPYRFQAVVVDESAGTISTVGGDSAAEVVSPLTDISFVITPRWWQSGPVRLALMLAIALGVVLAWRWSVHRLVEQKRHLEMAVLHRTEDLEREKAELLRAREQMRHFAEHDDLTGMWNHRIILERLRQEVDRSRRERSPLSVILVDLDHFKNVNDTFGHQAGDLVLKEIGGILQASVRSYDWVGRYGGEEFLLILPGSGFAGARIRAEQLRMAVQWAHIHDGQRAIPITASFGVACGLPSHFEALLRASDAALYRAKEKGRNCVIATEIQTGEGAEAVEDQTG